MAKRKPKGYWESIGNAISEAYAFMERHDFEKLPCASTLERLGYSSLGYAIRTHHGGFESFRKHLNEESVDRRVGKDMWKRLDYALEQAKEVMIDNGLSKLPSHEGLIDLGAASLSVAIVRYHGGFHEFRKSLGESPQRAKVGTWRDFEKCIRAVVQIVHEGGLDGVPSSRYLRARGYGSLASAITKYHGCMSITLVFLK